MSDQLRKTFIGRRARSVASPAYSGLKPLRDRSFMSVIPLENGGLDLQAGWLVQEFSHDPGASALHVQAESASTAGQWSLGFDGVERSWINRRGADDALEDAGLGDAVSQLEVWRPVGAGRGRWFRLVLRELDILAFASGIRLFRDRDSPQSPLAAREHREPPVWLDAGACRVCGSRDDVYYERGSPTYADCLRCLAESGVDEYSVAAVTRYRTAWIERLGEPRTS